MFFWRHRTTAFLIAVSVGLILLWLPNGTWYPPWNDTAVYYLLGKSMWTAGSYTLAGEAFSRQLPLHALLLYPLTLLIGVQKGAALSTLLAGWLFVLLSFTLLRTIFDDRSAMLGTLFVLFQHGFVLMTAQGSADLLFAALFLLSLVSFLRAEEDERWYLLCGIATGLSCLTRYNGVPLLLFYPAWTLLFRDHHRNSRWFWSGMAAGGLLFGLWLVRNALAFGNPFFTGYAQEAGAQSIGLVRQTLSNVVYYINPLHNFLPVIDVLCVIGLWRGWRSRLLPLCATLAVLTLSLPWHVQGMRFVAASFPLLAGFAAYGTWSAWEHAGRWRLALALPLVTLLIPMHAGALCIYSFGTCNAWFDRTIGGIPRNLGLSPEGLWSWEQARVFLNASAARGAAVVVDTSWNRDAWRELFRSDLALITEPDQRMQHLCPAYRIRQNVAVEHPLFVSASDPRSYVTVDACPDGSQK